MRQDKEIRKRLAITRLCLKIVLEKRSYNLTDIITQYIQVLGLLPDFEYTLNAAQMNIALPA